MLITIFIPDIDFSYFDKKQIFILARPFYTANGWDNIDNNFSNWNVNEQFRYTNNIEKAKFALIPIPINWYFSTGNWKDLFEYNKLFKQHNIKGFGIISNDFGPIFPEYSNIFYFRIGGFKSQLSTKNIGFPVSLSDHFQRIYKQDNPIPRMKSEKPLIGFCGHANNSFSKRLKEIAKCFLENGSRFIRNPIRNDWEPLFASAYERWKLLNKLKQSSKLDCRFIFRIHYRGGAINKEDREKTTLEYYDNLFQTDYVLCVRGAGNFSVRFYEALMMGKIPIFVNTDCLLPLEDEIDWKKQVVWVEWHQRKNIDEIVYDFHQKISEEAFIQLQLTNRQIWKKKLTTSYYLNKISNAV